MSATGSEIEIVNIRSAIIELLRHHMKCVIPEGQSAQKISISSSLLAKIELQIGMR
jgi:hypothetical protein